jgi:hypothetical protein
VSRLRRFGSRRGSSDGQALIEFTVIVPVFMLLMTGLLEFGMVFAHHLTLEYGTREGARTGAALANGDGDTTVCATIDPSIVAAVERVLKAPGSPVVLSDVSQISIWRSNASGQAVAGALNLWKYTGPGTGPLVDGVKLSFSPASEPWSACSRIKGPNGDSVGVSLTYRYQMITPLANIMGFFGGPGAQSLQMDDETVMALHP